MAEKKILITGSTDGIGRQTAHNLASKGYQVIVHGRNKDSVEGTMNDLKEKTGKQNIFGYVADFESLQEVKELAEKISEEHPELDILLNNAGIIQNSKEYTADEFEKTFGVNYLAPFLLTRLLIAVLSKPGDTRIINVSSMIHASSIDFENLQGEKFFDGSEAYGLSKLCNILFTYKLARVYSQEDFVTHCLHPGVINTKLLRKNFGNIGNPVEEGASNLEHAAISEELGNITGKYFRDQREHSSASISYDVEIQDNLWEISNKMVEPFLK
jgi:NAD(P)-dependent dehydrogenase (short-subunit alcohol dehydrogenase family)